MIKVYIGWVIGWLTVQDFDWSRVDLQPGSTSAGWSSLASINPFRNLRQEGNSPAGMNALDALDGIGGIMHAAFLNQAAKSTRGAILCSTMQACDQIHHIISMIGQSFAIL